MGFCRVLPKVKLFLSKYCTQKSSSQMMKYLNVAEKNDAAKNIASILSNATSTRREGLSQYNKIYEFNCTVRGQQALMVMTSVSGHLLNYEFNSAYRSWTSCNPVQLFDAPVVKVCPEQYLKIKLTLEREIRSCQGLIIWTDCDREGENIGFEVIKVCTDVEPNLRIYRAKFSEITATSIYRALNTLGEPNKNVSDAVDVRQELDLRTGAAFTRLQTLRLQKVFPSKLENKLISYGSCQFPTLGFVVERYQAIENFIPEDFWRIKMNHTMKEITTEFTWGRGRLFEKNACEAILDVCKENPTATVEQVTTKPKSKWRPLPLDTVEMEKNISKKLKINAKEAMKIAEKLYTQGFISYPRTETNIFPKELSLQPLVEGQRGDPRWGAFADRVLHEGGPCPRQGRKSDQAHPPIHPTKYTNTLTGNDSRVYEYIVRHFLACLHKDAQGFETAVDVDVAGEKFTAKGLIILEKNYLEVYIYDKWNAKEIGNYQEGQTFQPTVLELAEGKTTAPNLLTEADLIALMDKHGIGTDATHAEHIDTIKHREYVGMHENMYFVPGVLGMGLVEGYNNIGLDISLAKPILRSEFENDLKLICDGVKNAETVRMEQIQKYKSVYQTVLNRIVQIDQNLAQRLNDNPQNVIEENIIPTIPRSVMKCRKCNGDMLLKNKKNSQGYYVSCTGYPACTNTLWLPGLIENIEIMDSTCPHCGPNVSLLKMKFKQNLFPGDPNPNILCIGGCDVNVLDALDIPSNRTVNSNQNSFVRPNNTNILSSTVTPSTSRNGSLANVNNTSSLNNLPVVASTSRNNSFTNENNQNTLNNMPTTSTSRNGSLTNVNNLNCINNISVASTSRNNSFSNVNNQNNLNNLPVPSTSRNSSSTNGFTHEFKGPLSRKNESSTDIVCHCHKTCLLLTVRKEGPNKGRKFYKCFDSTCNFFLWDSEGSENAEVSNLTVNVNNSGVMCNCNEPAVLRTVQKQGPNTGRQFYCCRLGQGQGCNFFKWANESNTSEGSGNDGNDDGHGGPSRPNQGLIWQGKANNTNNQTRTKRKCSVCKQEGHTKKKCPRIS